MAGWPGFRVLSVRTFPSQYRASHSRKQGALPRSPNPNDGPCRLLLRIMAGEDSDFGGAAFLAEGMTVGFLPREPKVPAGATVRECVEEAVAQTRARSPGSTSCRCGSARRCRLRRWSGCSTSRRSSRTRSRPPARGSWTAGSSWRRRCGCRRRRPRPPHSSENTLMIMRSAAAPTS